jgi:ribonuclease HI
MNKTLLPHVEIFTDGACRGNPGPGGWGVVLRYQNNDQYLHGGEDHTTNNRMELLAVIKALAALPEAYQATITTDSQYVHKGITEWVKNWKKRDWRTSDNKPVKNKDLWQALDHEIARHDIKWHWVRGHNGHIENELADELANKGLEEQMKTKLLNTTKN